VTIINDHLNYDINQPLDPDSLDIKNIKELLSRIEKYILGKDINSNKANDIKDFEDLGKAAWEFITTLYSSQWDSLTVDGTNQSFRNNVKSKFSP